MPKPPGFLNILQVDLKKQLTHVSNATVYKVKVMVFPNFALPCMTMVDTHLCMKKGDHYSNLDDAPQDLKRLTITKNDLNWRRFLGFKNLRELTLYEPTQDQISALNDMPSLIRLRLLRVRPQNLEFLRVHDQLEELALIYVSRFDDIAPVGKLQKLRVLWVENLRHVQDFSNIGQAQKLEFLSIQGTPDWKQPIENFYFISSLLSLRYLQLNAIRILDQNHPITQIAQNLSLREVRIEHDLFSLEDYALFEANRPEIKGAKRRSYNIYGGEPCEIHPTDFRASYSDEDFLNLPGTKIASNGRRYFTPPMRAHLLGKGVRAPTGKEETIRKKCAEHDAKYQALLERFKAELQRQTT